MNYDADKLIGANLETSMAKHRRIRNFAIAAIPFGFLMFGGGTPLTILTEKIFLVFIPILGFCFIPGGFITLAIQATKMMYLRQIKNAVDIVKTQDKVFIYQLAGGAPSVELQYVVLLQKLIDTGTLAGYKLVGNYMIVKESVYISEEEAEREYLKLRFGKIDDDAEKVSASQGAFEAPSTAESATKECYYCHAVLPADAVYCSKCGARLDY